MPYRISTDGKAIPTVFELPVRHVPIVSAAAIDPPLCALECFADGTVDIEDSEGNELTWTVTAGKRIDMWITKVTDNGLTVATDCIGLVPK